MDLHLAALIRSAQVDRQFTAVLSRVLSRTAVVVYRIRSSANAKALILMSLGKALSRRSITRLKMKGDRGLSYFTLLNGKKDSEVHSVIRNAVKRVIVIAFTLKFRQLGRNLIA